MVAKLAYILILGKPLTMYLGILTFLAFSTTATLGFLIHKGYRIPFKIHPTVAAISLLLAVIHGVLGIAIYFNF
ncbi:MAG: hypothetical protein WC606_02015 [Candidatus Absconditabacterales bacterium]